MSRRRKRTDVPGPEFHIQVTLPVPVDFAYRWCTDFQPTDAALEGEEYQRRILSRTARRVVFEDLGETPVGWDWARYEVDLQPPDGWHMQRTGNHAHIVGDYRLTALGRQRTRFDLWWRRQPALVEYFRMSKNARERGTAMAWKRFARAMGKDYRRPSRGRKARR